MAGAALWMISPGPFPNACNQSDDCCVRQTLPRRPARSPGSLCGGANVYLEINYAGGTARTR